VTLLRHAAALVLGLLVSLASVAVHRSAFPLGLALAVVTTYAVAWWLLRSAHPRTATTYVAGWLAAFAVVLRGRPEGDFVLAQDLKGVLLMVAGLGLVAIAAAGLPGRRRSGT
jgi:hypothetical protein